MSSSGPSTNWWLCLLQVQGLKRESDWSSPSFRADCNSLCVQLAQGPGPGLVIIGQRRWGTEYLMWQSGPAPSAGSVGWVDPHRRGCGWAGTVLTFPEYSLVKEWCVTQITRCYTQVRCCYIDKDTDATRKDIYKATCISHLPLVCLKHETNVITCDMFYLKTFVLSSDKSSC